MNTTSWLVIGHALPLRRRISFLTYQKVYSTPEVSIYASIFTSIPKAIHLMITEPKQGASILSISLNGRARIVEARTDGAASFSVVLRSYLGHSSLVLPRRF